MREVLDRLREAETAIDRELMEVYYRTLSLQRTATIDLLWKAKQDIWSAIMRILHAAGADPAADVL